MRPQAHHIISRRYVGTSVQTLRLCDCNNTARGCNIWSPQLLCYPALALLHVTMFLSALMVTAILWMLISVVWGLFGGVMRGVGAVRHWSEVQGAMDTLQKDMMMYAPFTKESDTDKTLTVCPCNPLPPKALAGVPRG